MTPELGGGYLDIRSLRKDYPTSRGVYPALGNVSLSIQEGEFVSVIGPSGCGKSTLLMMIAGLIQPTEGSIILDGTLVTGPGLDRGVVFQSYALLPWMTATQNIAFALECARYGADARERLDMAARLLERVHLSDAADKRPGQLSGGMRQRVGIARALAVNPKVLLLDEPLSALDFLTRQSLQVEILRLLEEERKTVVLVTHDVDEALLLSDRIVVLTRGPGARVGATLNIPFERPRRLDEIMQMRAYHELRHGLLGMLIAEADAAVAA
jgi:nitrate ABC transporter ATP-binding subunit